MHRSFKAWRQELETDPFCFDTPDKLEKDLKELEAALPISMKEAEQLKKTTAQSSSDKRSETIRPYENQPFQAGPYHQQNGSAGKTAALSPRQARLAQFTETLAQEVIEKLERLEQLEARDTQREEQWRQYRPKVEKIDALIRDNHTLAQQVRMLLEERDRLHQELAFFEREFPRFQKVMGNMYLRQ